MVDYPALDDAVGSDAPLSVESQFPIDSPSVFNPDLDFRLCRLIYSLEFNSMFTDFTEQLRSRFTKIDERFDSLDSVSLSSVPVSRGTIDISRDVTNPSCTTPTSVAMLTKHGPDKVATCHDRVAWRSPQDGRLQRKHSRVVFPFPA